MADSSQQTMTWTEFQVDLQQLGTTVQSVGGLAQQLEGTLANMKANLMMCESAWTSPSSPSFQSIVEWYTSCETQLTTLLDVIVSRLQTAYENYLNVEQTNIGNAN